MRVLITNNHILGEKDILIGNSINFSLDDEKYEYKIKIDKSRLIYSNVKYDVSIIEIKEKDYLEKNLFLNLDDNILNIDQYQIYKDISIYLLHYPKGENIECSIGVLKNISDDYELLHLCGTQKGSSGGPIINLNNYKVIGIHKGSDITKNWNKGTFLKGPIKDFNEIYKHKKEDNPSYEVKEIIPNYQSPKLNMNQLQIILNQMKYSVCKIVLDKISGTLYFLNSFI